VIRRQAGQDFLLITQREHVRLASHLAQHAGGKFVRAPHDRPAFLDAVDRHDVGWDALDEPPRLNARKWPMDVLEAPWQIAVPAWAQTTRLALEGASPRTSLLVSIHTLNLSYDASRVNEGPKRFDISELRRMFEVNKFQHGQIEIQELLRPELGLSIDQPRRLGLSMDLRDVAEQHLANDYRMIQACDLLSYSACVGDVVANPLGPLYAAGPGGEFVSVLVRKLTQTKLTLSPWPFDCGEIRFAVNARRYPAHATRSLPEFQYFYSQAHDEPLTLEIAPG